MMEEAYSDSAKEDAVASVLEARHVEQIIKSGGLERLSNEQVQRENARRLATKKGSDGSLSLTVQLDSQGNRRVCDPCYCRPNMNLNPEQFFFRYQHPPPYGDSKHLGSKPPKLQDPAGWARAGSRSWIDEVYGEIARDGPLLDPSTTNVFFHPALLGLEEWITFLTAMKYVGPYTMERIGETWGKWLSHGRVKYSDAVMALTFEVPNALKCRARQQDPSLQPLLTPIEKVTGVDPISVMGLLRTGEFYDPSDPTAQEFSIPGIYHVYENNPEVWCEYATPFRMLHNALGTGENTMSKQPVDSDDYKLWSRIMTADLFDGTFDEEVEMNICKHPVSRYEAWLDSAPFLRCGILLNTYAQPHRKSCDDQLIVSADYVEIKALRIYVGIGLLHQKQGMAHYVCRPHKHKTCATSDTWGVLRSVTSQRPVLVNRKAQLIGDAADPWNMD